MKWPLIELPCHQGQCWALRLQWTTFLKQRKKKAHSYKVCFERGGTVFFVGVNIIFLPMLPLTCVMIFPLKTWWVFNIWFFWSLRYWRGSVMRVMIADQGYNPQTSLWTFFIGRWFGRTKAWGGGAVSMLYVLGVGRGEKAELIKAAKKKAVKMSGNMFCVLSL